MTIPHWQAKTVSRSKVAEFVVRTLGWSWIARQCGQRWRGLAAGSILTEGRGQRRGLSFFGDRIAASSFALDLCDTEPFFPPEAFASLRINQENGEWSGIAEAAGRFGGCLEVGQDVPMQSQWLSRVQSTFIAGGVVTLSFALNCGDSEASLGEALGAYIPLWPWKYYIKLSPVHLPENWPASFNACLLKTTCSTDRLQDATVRNIRLR